MMSDPRQAEWHQGELVADRLHRFLLEASMYRTADNYDDWYDSVCNLRMELAGFMNEEELRISKELLARPARFLKIPKSKRGIMGKTRMWLIIEDLEEAQIFLRRVMNRYGLDVRMSGKSASKMLEEFE